ESLLWTSAKLFSTAGSHILFVFLLLAGILLLTGASIASIITATREAAATTTGRMRRTGAGTAATERIPYEPLPPIAPPEPEDREPVVRATHVEMPVQAYEGSDPEGSDPLEEPMEDDSDWSRGQTPAEVDEAEFDEAELDPGGLSPAEMEPELTPMGNRRSPVTESEDIEYTLPKLSFLKRSSGAQKI